MGCNGGGRGTEPDIIHWSNSTDALLLPPGKYDVYWLQDYDHRDHVLLLHDGVQVKSGTLTTVAADCGIRLKVPRRRSWTRSTAGGG